LKLLSSVVSARAQRIFERRALYQGLDDLPCPLGKIGSFRSMGSDLIQLRDVAPGVITDERRILALEEDVVVEFFIRQLDGTSFWFFILVRVS
jgi:hypothetical protein